MTSVLASRNSSPLVRHRDRGPLEPLREPYARAPYFFAAAAALAAAAAASASFAFCAACFARSSTPRASADVKPSALASASNCVAQTPSPRFPSRDARTLARAASRRRLHEDAASLTLARSAWNCAINAFCASGV